MDMGVTVQYLKVMSVSDNSSSGTYFSRTMVTAATRLNTHGICRKYVPGFGQDSAVLYAETFQTPKNGLCMPAVHVIYFEMALMSRE